MKILIVSSDITRDDYFFNAFAPVAEKNELQICRSITEADAFVSRELVLHQKQLDIVITELFKNENRSAREFCYDIRNDHKNTFSSSNFKLSSIPILLMHPGRINRSQYVNFGFDEVVDSEDDFDFFNTLLAVAKDVVKKWRNILYDDLETLKVGKDQNFNKASFILQQSKSEMTKILTEQYIRNQNKLDVAWFQRDHGKLEASLDLFARKIKEAEKSKRKEEKKFHRIVNSHHELLLRGGYSKHFYEPRFPKTSDHDIQIPDYILQPYYASAEIDVTEFKTPNEKFFEQTRFHPTLLKAVFKHIGQVKDYKDYLEDPENEEHLQKVLSLKPIKVRYNLVMGRRSDFGSRSSLFQRRARQFNLEELRVVTFDDFLDDGERYHNEMLELSV